MTGESVALRILRTRWIVRLPISLYKARLGFLFGNRFLLIEHYGRTTGKRRFAVLEVIDRPSRGRYLVISGFGEKSDWLKNIRANSRVVVTVGVHGPAAATAQVLGPTGSATALQGYAKRHPRAWRAAKPVLEGALGKPITDGSEATVVEFTVGNRTLRGTASS